MADILISQLEEGIPVSSDHVIYDPLGSGYYKKSQVGNLPGGSGGLTTLSTPTLTASVISSTQIDLSWTNVANESSYKLEWSPNGTTGWTQIGGTIPADTLAYSHTGLTAATAYYYRVSAIGDGVTYSDSGYGTDNDTTSAGSGVEAIDWDQLNDATDAGSGTLDCTASSGDAGATATKRIVKSTGNYVQFTIGATVSDSEANVLLITDDNDAIYAWDGSRSILAAAYHFSAAYLTVTGTAASGALGTTGGAPTTGDVVRLEVSGDNILMKVNGTTVYTHTGVLSGISNLYVIGVFAAPSTSKSLELCEGLGLVAI
jgi:hypothetical protein